MGMAEVKGKNVNVEVVEGGTYKLEIPDGPTHYASSVKPRPPLGSVLIAREVPEVGGDTLFVDAYAMWEGESFTIVCICVDHVF